MAKNKNGYTGGMSGTMGNLVAYQSNGMSYIRRRPEYKGNRILTDKQILQRAKFQLATSFYRSIKELLVNSFEKTPGVTTRNASLANMLGDAVEGNIGNLFIDFTDVLVAKGSLKKARFPVASSTQGGIIRFDWQSIDVTGASANDKAILVAWCEELQEVWYILEGPRRSTLQGELNAPFFSGKVVHTWVSFMSPDGKLKADSVYAGEVQVV